MSDLVSSCKNHWNFGKMSEIVATLHSHLTFPHFIFCPVFAQNLHHHATCKQLATTLTMFHHKAITKIGLDVIYKSSQTLHSIMTVDGFPNEFEMLSSSDSENGKVSNNVTDDSSDNEDIVHWYWNMITCRNYANALIEVVCENKNWSFTFRDTDDWLQQPNNILTSQLDNEDAITSLDIIWGHQQIQALPSFPSSISPWGKINWIS